MRNLKNDNTQTTKHSRPSRDALSVVSNTFKRDIQLLEKVILKKLNEKPVSSGNLLAAYFSKSTKSEIVLTPSRLKAPQLRCLLKV